MIERHISPNQYHGYSAVHGLKEQFMMRCCGAGAELTSPGLMGDTKIDLGVTGMKLYEELDQLCRRTTRSVLQHLGLPTTRLDDILDPVYKLSSQSVRTPNNPQCCTSDYLPPGFISSSIMDNFHYFNKFDQSVAPPSSSSSSLSPFPSPSPANSHSRYSSPLDDDLDDEKAGTRFYNNHASHTDSGLMTVVVVTDVPGLEVKDQLTGEWVALEQLLHQYCYPSAVERSHFPQRHRKYATLFWADSCVYLQEKELLGSEKIAATFHRVEKNTMERYSVVFKQRTSPTATAPRYQEDYEVMYLRPKIIAIVIAIFFFLAGGVCCWAFFFWTS